MSMENVTNIKNEGLSRIEACESLADLQESARSLSGKKGTDPGSDEVNEGSFQRRNVPHFGQKVNELKQTIAAAIEEKRAVLGRKRSQ